METNFYLTGYCFNENHIDNNNNIYNKKLNNLKIIIIIICTDWRPIK